MPEHNAATGQATKTKRMSHSREYIGFPAILNYLLLFLMSKRFREICEMEDGEKLVFSMIPRIHSSTIPARRICVGSVVSTNKSGICTSHSSRATHSYIGTCSGVYVAGCY
jgi:hypothetical protein